MRKKQSDPIESDFIKLINLINENREKKAQIKLQIKQKETAKNALAQTRDMKAEFARALMTPLPDDDDEWESVDEEEEEDDDDLKSTRVDVVPKLVSSALDVLEFIFNSIYVEGYVIPNEHNLVKLGNILLESIGDDIFFEYDSELYLLQIDLLCSIVSVMKRNGTNKDFANKVWGVISTLEHQIIKQEINEKRKIFKQILGSD